jgi:hypothetical protein
MSTQHKTNFQEQNGGTIALDHATKLDNHELAFYSFFFGFD